MNESLRGLSRYAIVVGLLGILTACNCLDIQTSSKEEPDWAGGCFTVASPASEPPPAPHTLKDDKFCIVREESVWWFQPGTGMENWQAIGGGTSIPMELLIVNPNNILWKFDVDVTDHPPPGSHGREHKDDWSFLVQVFNHDDPSKTSARLRGAGGPMGDTHGGSAHANLD